ncbi:MAG: PDZ domain-containing protein [Firmicutes bacterium]|nr:PDZ domain-containing protein [Bacillota bacterium]
MNGDYTEDIMAVTPEEETAARQQADQQAAAQAAEQPAVPQAVNPQQPDDQHLYRYIPYDGYYGYRVRQKNAEAASTGLGTKVFVGILCVVLAAATAFGAAVLGAQAGYKAKEQRTANAMLVEGDEVQRVKAADGQTAVYSSVSEIISDVSHSLATILVDGNIYALGALVSEDNTYLYIGFPYHVISGASQIQLIFGEEDGLVYTPEVQGTDIDTDLALLKVRKSDIDEEQRKELKLATLGDSDSLVLGDTAISFSSPEGYFNTPSLGTVSGLEREVSVTLNGAGYTLTTIQTDAAVNTAGVLFNGRGEAVGFTLNMTFENSEGIGFAVPSAQAADVFADLIRQGFVERPYMGFSGYDVMNFYPNNGNMSWAQYYELPAGVLVAQVNEGSPADEAGLEVYDVIIGFNGESISAFSDLKTDLNKCKPGDTVTVEVLRGYMEEGGTETVELTMTLIQKPQQ